MRSALMRNERAVPDAGKRGVLALRERAKHWLRGASTVLVLFPDTGTRMRKRFLERTDAEALAGDWQRVGDDLRNAIRKYDEEQATDKDQNKPSTKPSVPAQRQQGRASPQEGQTLSQEGQPPLQVTEFSGPLPPPGALEKYDLVSPGAAKRIFAMAERESSHRRELEKSLVDNEYKEAGKGQNCAVTLGALAIVSGTIAGISGAQWTGSMIGGLGMIGLVSAFIRGRRGK